MLLFGDGAATSRRQPIHSSTFVSAQLTDRHEFRSQLLAFDKSSSGWVEGWGLAPCIETEWNYLSSSDIWWSKKIRVSHHSKYIGASGCAEPRRETAWENLKIWYIIICMKFIHVVPSLLNRIFTWSISRSHAVRNRIGEKNEKSGKTNRKLRAIFSH